MFSISPTEVLFICVSVYWLLSSCYLLADKLFQRSISLHISKTLLNKVSSGSLIPTEENMNKALSRASLTYSVFSVLFGPLILIIISIFSFYKILFKK